MTFEDRRGGARWEFRLDAVIWLDVGVASERPKYLFIGSEIFSANG